MTYLSKISERKGSGEGVMCAAVTSNVLTAKQKQRKKASLGSDTQIYKYTHQCTNIYVQKAKIHSIRHEKLSACLLAQKKERKSHLTDIFNLRQTMTLWPPVMLNWRAHCGKASQG
ncbi:hypothetical protein ILYODFUR_005969 [Ilyodon furcidens]|uniref:Uncharacterized protein n=1 Tax=Ilyodon furcidens TaxID=33524 RepID=A0ABV0SX63_9TELE